MKCLAFIRPYSSKAMSIRSSKLIRKEFLDYFSDLGHTPVRSSPVTPLNDRSLAFVNSGMNQFKGVFLGYHEPLAPNIVNSQKCIRVGGKHNDLKMVGNDTYHHTFFEMLGNWSFNGYFKKEACRYALDMLIGPYRINKAHIYVTYFAGDKKLGLEPDVECKEIWLSLGIEEDKILPFGMAHNFWEMGLSGPCGPCTEIHIDHMGRSVIQSAWVNKNYPDLTELWNIVFIQYERLPNGSIVPLDKCYVDTGMGFERLVALLQGKVSNYDTDLFQPLFNTIQKYTNAPEYTGKFGSTDKNGIDYGYRILADHARMVSVALADGMIPEENYKLRRILRKAINVSETIFQKKNILRELSLIVTEVLGDVYPELQHNVEQIQRVIQYEEEVFKELRKSSEKEWKQLLEINPKLNLISDWTPAGLVLGYKYLSSIQENIMDSNILPGDVAFKLYDTYGLNVETISELAELQSLYFDESLLQKELDNRRYESKLGGKSKFVPSQAHLSSLEVKGFPKTDDSFKYVYFTDAGSYKFPDLEVKLLGIILEGDLILEADHVKINKVRQPTAEVGLIFDRTSCYSTEGGQTSDKGRIYVNDLIFSIERVVKLNGYVIHFGTFAPEDLQKTNTTLRIGDSCIIAIDPEVRLGAMQHHTATHLLNAALKKVLHIAHQSFANVHEDCLKFTFNSFGENFTVEQMATVEKLVNMAIEAKVPLNTKIVNFSELLAENDITLVSKDTYPYNGIRIVDINTDNLHSKEPCCGTHVTNTKDLEKFYFLSCTSKGRTKYSVKAIVGHSTQLLERKSHDLQSTISTLEAAIKAGDISDMDIDSKIQKVRKQLDDAVGLPYFIKEEVLRKIKILKKEHWMHRKELEQQTIAAEIYSAIEASPHPFIVHCLTNKAEYLSLNEIMSFFPKMPVLIIMYQNSKVKATCSVPMEIVTDKFQAANWISTVAEVFNAKCTPVRNTNVLYAMNMESKRIASDTFTSLIQKAVLKAMEFAETSIKLSKDNEKNTL